MFHEGSMLVRGSSHGNRAGHIPKRFNHMASVRIYSEWLLSLTKRTSDKLLPYTSRHVWPFGATQHPNTSTIAMAGSLHSRRKGVSDGTNQGFDVR